VFQPPKTNPTLVNELAVRAAVDPEDRLWGGVFPLLPLALKTIVNFVGVSVVGFWHPKTLTKHSRINPSGRDSFKTPPQENRNEIRLSQFCNLHQLLPHSVHAVTNEERMST
jgi:hypothetical protein